MANIGVYLTRDDCDSAAPSALSLFLAPNRQSLISSIADQLVSQNLARYSDFALIAKFVVALEN